jgi:DNA-binding NtrC family response regulator
MEQLSILIVDDEEGYRREIKELLLNQGYSAQTASMPSEALELLDKNTYDIMLLDLGLPEMSGIELLKLVKQGREELEVIVVTGHADMESSVAALRAGASDFITKPFHNIDLEQAIERTRKCLALRHRLKATEQSMLSISNELKSLKGNEIVGNSQAIRTVLQQMKKVSTSGDTTVLIHGESGTGKELVARGIHHMSKRKNNFFHSVNCAAVPETLFESEFFGYQKGAFTGANETLPGWFEISDNGTLFLDEISGLPLPMQSKMLRVLDQKSITKLGSHKELMLNLRIITATNQDLETMVAAGSFRNDLYHRLATFKIFLPPLRERKEDIPLLVQHFIERFNILMTMHITGIEDSALNALMAYDFPGNVRELKNMIERAFILCSGRRIRKKDLGIPGDLPTPLPASPGTLNLAALEKNAIREAMSLTKDNKSRAAEMLGITRQALDRRIKEERQGD